MQLWRGAHGHTGQFGERGGRGGGGPPGGWVNPQPINSNTWKCLCKLIVYQMRPNTVEVTEDSFLSISLHGTYCDSSSIVLGHFLQWMRCHYDWPARRVLHLSRPHTSPLGAECMLRPVAGALLCARGCSSGRQTPPSAAAAPFPPPLPYLAAPGRVIQPPSGWDASRLALALTGAPLPARPALPVRRGGGHGCLAERGRPAGSWFFFAGPRLRPSPPSFP